ncbi:MAG TPA: alkylated DNA repair dioxygenase [Cyanobacteria bacterium UBA8553]|nr:alkylated DNA repair dioxygenase [Cyanobacteria bacterium UBA8553]HAJ64283.1 alkylated DNA repair dioxygenase [Cyanobacteria bacterium UBA8543]
MIYHFQLINKEERKEIIAELREVIQQAPWFIPKMKNGSKFNYRMSNCGKYGWISDRQGYRYVESNPYTGKPWPAIPDRVIAQIDYLKKEKIIPCLFKPESMLVNQYLAGESLGIHQDKTEQNLTPPIISISLGTPGIFLLGGLKGSQPIREIVLNPGDVFIMSGNDRMRFHGFKSIICGTKRINLTIRQIY